MDVLVRQAHPGGHEPAYASFEEKLSDGWAYQREEHLPWPVVVDDLQGTVHHAYGGLSDPAYLIDSDGRIALFCAWTAPKVLRRGIEDLLARGGRGIVQGGVRRAPELGPMLTDGWRAMQRGAPGSVVDLALAAPPAPILLWLGSRRPAPLLLAAVGVLGLGLIARRLG